MGYAVFLTADAEHDLEAIYDYIAKHDSPKNAATSWTDYRPWPQNCRQYLNGAPFRWNYDRSA